MALAQPPKNQCLLVNKSTFSTSTTLSSYLFDLYNSLWLILSLGSLAYIFDTSTICINFNVVHVPISASFFFSEEEGVGQVENGRTGKKMVEKKGVTGESRDKLNDTSPDKK